MKLISRAIDRFCTKHRRFGIPRLMRYIVFISVAVYIVALMDGTGSFLPLLSFQPGRILRGEIWRLVTWVFLPLDTSPFFVALMLYFYYFVGNSLEGEWGTPKFTFYYLFGVVLNIIYGFLAGSFISGSLWLTPSFLNLSLFFAFAALFPEHRIMLFFIIPIKVKWMALINACFFAYSVVSNLMVGLYAMAFLPIVAIFHFFVICGSDVLDQLRPVKSRASPQSINFRQAAKKARRNLDDKHYYHKCAVCGKTDTDYPDLEFRYCSRCDGYHCFCVDHINNHVHF